MAFELDINSLNYRYTRVDGRRNKKYIAHVSVEFPLPSKYSFYDIHANDEIGRIAYLNKPFRDSDASVSFTFHADKPSLILSEEEAIQRTKENMPRLIRWINNKIAEQDLFEESETVAYQATRLIRYAADIASEQAMKDIDFDNKLNELTRAYKEAFAKRIGSAVNDIEKQLEDPQNWNPVSLYLTKKDGVKLADDTPPPLRHPLDNRYDFYNKYDNDFVGRVKRIKDGEE